MSPLKIYAPIGNLSPSIVLSAERRWDGSDDHVQYLNSLYRSSPECHWPSPWNGMIPDKPPESFETLPWT